MAQVAEASSAEQRLSDIKMKFQINIITDNDAFINSITGQTDSLEISRILRHFSQYLADYNPILEDMPAKELRDWNGNVVGTAEIIQ